MSFFGKLFGWEEPVRIVLISFDGEERVRVLRHDEQGRPYALAFEALSYTKNYLLDDGALGYHQGYITKWKPLAVAEKQFPSFEGVSIGATK